MCYTEELRPPQTVSRSEEKLAGRFGAFGKTCTSDVLGALSSFLSLFLKSNLIGLILPFCLPSVLHYTVFLHSRTPISSCSYTVRCLLAPSSGNRNPTAVPSQHIEHLCPHISAVKNCSFLTNTQLGHVRYYNTIM